MAELFCTSLWFSANGAAAELLRGWGLPPSSVGALTSAVQGGFIFPLFKNAKDGRVFQISIKTIGYASGFRFTGFCHLQRDLYRFVPQFRFNLHCTRNNDH